MFDFEGRTELLIGKSSVEKLNNSCVAVFGIGGVGSFCAEALVRAGIGKIVLIDSDTVALSNINRQIHALHSTIGMPKVEVMAARIKDINPNVEVITYNEFYSPEKGEKLISKDYDYVIDAVDTVTAKIDIVVRCSENNIPVISSMGAGNKLNPAMFEVADIYETSVCPLAKVMRYELRKRGIKKLKVVYSKETPIKINSSDQDFPSENTNVKKHYIPGSISFVPPVAGLIIAGEVVNDLIK